MDRLAQYFKALSEEVRLRIVMLLTHGELCVCDIMEVLDEPQSKVSRHLSYLKSSGVITAKRVGVWMHYALREEKDETLDAQIDFMRQRLSQLPSFTDDMAKMDVLKERKRRAGPRPSPRCRKTETWATAKPTTKKTDTEQK